MISRFLSLSLSFDDDEFFLFSNPFLTLLFSLFLNEMCSFAQRENFLSFSLCLLYMYVWHAGKRERKGKEK